MIFAIPAWAAAALAALLTGCQADQDRLVHDNYMQIRQDLSTQAEVQRIMGEPDRRLARQWLYERPEKHLIVLVDFDETGLVTRKQWIDAAGEFWDDSNDQR